MTNAFSRSLHRAAGPFPRVPRKKNSRIISRFCFSALSPARPSRRTTLTYNDGDLFLGFRATDRTSDYLINIKQPAQFVNAPPGSTFQVDVGTTSADLITAFGSDWYTRIDPNTGVSAVQWAVTGGRADRSHGRS